MKTFADRLIWARQTKGWTQKQLAVAAEVAQSTIGSLESGARAEPRRGPQIAAALGVDPLWLVAGVGEPTPSPSLDGSRPVEMFNAGNPHVLPIPKVQIQVRAGIDGFSIDAEEDGMDTYPIERSWCERNGFNQSRLIAMVVKGDSMEPNLIDGDVIIVNTADTKPKDGDPYVINFGGEVVVKRLTRDAGEWWLTSDNTAPRYHRRIVRTNETKVVGKVVKRDTTKI